MPISKVEIRRLQVSSPPVPDEGGIVRNSSGDLFQVVNGPIFRFLSYVEFDPAGKQPRGNHYHETKVETMIVIRGKLRATYLDLDTSELHEVEIERGDVVTIQPRCAHVYLPLEFTEAIEIAPAPVAISDTYPLDVLAGRARRTGMAL